MFDLLASLGMTNIRWRTPGADGGRDIEGITVETDLSGVQVAKKWFVECKRYSTSVDWPTIYSKLAYADSHQADVLLLCTTAQFSPAAISQVDAWNSTRRPLSVRLWPVHQLELQLLQHPDLMLKYRLSDAPSTPGKSIVALALTLSKTVSSHYSRIVFRGETPDPMLHAAQALADLFSRRMEDLDQTGTIRVSYARGLRTTLPIDSCSINVEELQIDEPSLRAFLSYLTALARAPLEVMGETPSSCRITSSADLADLVERYRAAFVAIATWGDLEFGVSGSAVQLRQRQ